MRKTLVAYFSASGTTEAVAKKLAQAANADLFEIEPKIPYTNADLNWTDRSSRSSVEMGDKSSRPEIVEKPLNTAGYDLILIGYPVWWYTAPTIVNTFFEKYDFAGKKIVLFATSGGSRFGSAVKDLSVSAPKAQIKEGKILNGNPSESALKEWIKEL